MTKMTCRHALITSMFTLLCTGCKSPESSKSATSSEQAAVPERPISQEPVRQPETREVLEPAAASQEEGRAFEVYIHEEEPPETISPERT